MRRSVIILFVLLSVLTGIPQGSKSYRIRTIAFYNVENLFDTINDSLTFDDDRTPEGKDRWTLDRYQLKIERLSKVIADIGAETTLASPDIVGLCEIENKTVIANLVSHSNLRYQDYGFVHYDSPDERGIDVALLYKRAVFLPTSFKSQRLLLFNEEEERDYTRDQLVVGGLLDDEEVYFIVNHWPSRSGGEAKSRPGRKAAAKLNKNIIDSIFLLNPKSKIINMGDLNDNPNDYSLKKILKTIGLKDSLKTNDLYNPMEFLYRKGAGSLAYRDQWSLFDQIILSGNLVYPKSASYKLWKAGIHNPPYLITPKGRYKGYPLRTYAGGYYQGGYSDHFPVFVYLIKEVK